MKNKEISDLFYKIADILDIEEVKWKPIAYRKAGRFLENLSTPIEDIVKSQNDEENIKKLKELPNIGEKLAIKILEYIKTGKIKEYEDLKKKEPKDLPKLLELYGIGPKKVELLYKKYNIKSIKELEKAIKNKKLDNIPLIKEKTVENLQKSIELYKEGNNRLLLGTAFETAKNISDDLKTNFKKTIKHIEIAGSIRRMKETIGDIDILITTAKKEDNKDIMDFFTNRNYIKKIISKGNTKSSVILKQNNTQVDLRIIDDKIFGAGLLYFTGSKDHNIELRKIAIKKGYKLSEYGLYKITRNNNNDQNKINNHFSKELKLIAGKTEKEIYEKLSMRYIDPEIRENKKEIELSLKNKLPALINYNDLRGDLHIHSNFSDGINTYDEIIKYALKKKYEYIAITDHSKSRKISNGLNEEKVIQNIKLIKNLQKKYPGIKIFSGAEVDILNNGELDYDKDILKKLDIVVASIHTGFKNSKEKITSRIINALENKYTTILGHPTGRLINQRKPYELNFDKIIESCKNNNKILEINSQPSRLDLNENYISKAIEHKIKLSINSDAHSLNQMDYVIYGIGQAKRAYAEKKDIINTLKKDELLKFLKKD